MCSFSMLEVFPQSAKLSGCPANWRRLSFAALNVCSEKHGLCSHDSWALFGQTKGFVPKMICFLFISSRGELLNMKALWDFGFNKASLLIFKPSNFEKRFSSMLLMHVLAYKFPPICVLSRTAMSIVNRRSRAPNANPSIVDARIFKTLKLCSVSLFSLTFLLSSSRSLRQLLRVSLSQPLLPCGLWLPAPVSTFVSLTQEKS